MRHTRHQSATYEGPYTPESEYTLWIVNNDRKQREYNWTATVDDSRNTVRSKPYRQIFARGRRRDVSNCTPRYSFWWWSFERETRVRRNQIPIDVRCRPYYLACLRSSFTPFHLRHIDCRCYPSVT